MVTSFKKYAGESHKFGILDAQKEGGGEYRGNDFVEPERKLEVKEIDDIPEPEEKVEHLVVAEEAGEEDEHPIRIRRKRIAKLKKQHGVVVPHVGETHTDLEKAIIDKSSKLWKGGDREMDISCQLLSGESLDFTEKTEETGKEDIKNPLEQGVKIEYKDSPVQVVREGIIGSNGNIVRVIYRGKEIAKGFLTKNGPDVSVKKEFKASFIFPATDEERAFEKAFEYIKTLKAN